MGLETIAIAAVVSATASTTFAALNYEKTQAAAKHAKDLENQQADQLRQEQEAAANQAALQAKTGSVFGFEKSSLAESFKSGLGFGTAPQGSANTGRGQITGMG